MQTVEATPLKGKHTGRSWADLPHELIRQIAMTRVAGDPQMFWTPLAWSKSIRVRNLWRVLLMSRELMKLCLVCPKWRAALDVDDFWRSACLCFDPRLSIHASATAAMSGSGHQSPLVRWHFNVTILNICLPCHLNSRFPLPFPVDSTLHSHHFGAVSVCTEHCSTEVCGVCLRDVRRLADAGSSSPVESEDQDTFPDVVATCADCRHEYLEHQLRANRLNTTLDAECTLVVENYVDMGEGTIREVLDQVLDKMWMNTQTKLRDMLSQAIASSRLLQAATSPNGHWSTADPLEFDSSDSEEEGLSWSEESNIKDLAVSDYNRSRIMDGFWLSPLDYYQIYWSFIRPPIALLGDRQLRHPLAFHPTNPVQTPHPAPHLSAAHPATTLALATILDRSFRRQMETLLMPALHNSVQKIYWDCVVDGLDPCVRAGRMSVEDVIRLLRLPEVWTTGFDWQARRILEREAEELHRETELNRLHPSDNTVSSHSSKSSEGDAATSPAISSSTLQTTPSPPPLTSSPSKPSSRSTSPLQVHTSVAPPVSIQVYTHIQYINSIPFVPITAAHFPPNTKDCFEQLWKTAVAPLFQCQCSICARRWQLDEQAKAAAGEYAKQSQAGIETDSPSRFLASTPTQNNRSTVNQDALTADGRNSLQTPSPCNPKKRSSAELDDDLTLSASEFQRSDDKSDGESPRSKKRRLKDSARECDDDEVDLPDMDQLEDNIEPDRDDQLFQLASDGGEPDFHNR